MTKSEILKIAKPILFNTEMVRAILDGRKTQTRRVIKHIGNCFHYDKLLCDWALSGKPYIKDGFLHWELQTDVDDSRVFKIKPKRQPGDILWVRETWSKDENGEYVYRANYGTTEDDSFPPSMFKWRPSIHMPREAARIFLRVKTVRVERLQDITEEDAIAEGMSKTLVDGVVFISAKGNFHVFWDSLNIKRGYGWDTNPWVWVYEFEKLEVENG